VIEAVGITVLNVANSHRRADWSSVSCVVFRPGIVGFVANSLEGLSEILCAGPVDHHVVTNLSSNMMAN
jgi:hypothetical protein